MDLVSNYDSAERQALANLPNRAIQAFGAVTFASVGYPFRVHNQAELWRYIDVMHEGRFEHNLALLKKVSSEELQLAAWLAKGTFDFSSSRYSRPFTGRHCLTRSLFQLRGIHQMRMERTGNKVLELGPGSGYLSLLMAKTGYLVDTVEVAQAFALHQSQFFSYFLPNDSWVIPQQGRESYNLKSTAGIRQIPWWSYADDSHPSFDYDLITANHALAEFQPDSLTYLLRRFGRQHNQRFGRSPVILAESLGARMRPWPTVIKQFHEHGWSHEFDGSFYVFRFEPERATQQLEVDVEQLRYESSLLRTVKRYTRIFINERVSKHKPKEALPAQDASLQTLRKVFDDLIPYEKTPDEHYWSDQ